MAAPAESTPRIVSVRPGLGIVTTNAEGPDDPNQDQETTVTVDIPEAPEEDIATLPIRADTLTRLQ